MKSMGIKGLINNEKRLLLTLWAASASNCLSKPIISTLISSAQQQINIIISTHQEQNFAAQTKILQALNATLISQMQNPWEIKFIAALIPKIKTRFLIVKTYTAIKLAFFDFKITCCVLLTYIIIKPKYVRS